jgi:hypothetical protein
MNYIQKGIIPRIILGNSFLALFDPLIKITGERISTEIMRKIILFIFILPLMTKDINVISKQIRNRKEKQIMFLKQDLKHKRIEEQLKEPLLQKIKKSRKNRIRNLY